MRKPLLVLACLCCLFPSGCTLLPEEEEILPPPLVERQVDLQYEMELVVRGDIAQEITINGVLTPARQTAYYFDTNGLRLLALHVKAGDVVTNGMLIAQADPGDLAYRIKVQSNMVRLAELRLQQSRKADKELRKLELENEKLALEQLEKQLDRCSLYADQDGVVLFAENLKEGESIEPFSVLVRMADPTELAVYAQSASLKNVRSGMKAYLTAGGVSFTGKVTLSPDNVPDKADSRYKDAVIITPDHLPDNLSIGTQVNMRIVLGQSENALLIPKRALRTAIGQTYVQVLSDGVRKEYDVETGIETTTQVEILSGLGEGMQVILK